MHETVFDGGPEDLIVRSPIQALVHCVSDSAVVRMDFRFSRPIRGLVIGQVSVDGIDSEREEPVELRMERFHPKPARTDEIPVERLNMPEVKHNAMALNDGPFVKRMGPDHLKQLVCAESRLFEVRQQISFQSSAY